MPQERCLLVLAKPAVAGRVKTRLVGALSAEQAARLHAAFLDDLLDRLRQGSFRLVVAWALDPGEEMPSRPVAGISQQEGDLGRRLFCALRWAARGSRWVAAVGSDHPELPLSLVERAFDKLSEGADVVLGPATDGGYYLVGFRRERLDQRVFEEIPWSTGDVLAQTVRRCDRLGLQVVTLAPVGDVDTPADLRRLAERLRAGSGEECPRTRELLRTWSWVRPPFQEGER